MANTQIKVSVLSDLSKFDVSKVNKDLDKMGASADKTNGRLTKIGGGFKKAFLPAVGALGTLGFATKGFISDAEEAASAQAKLNNVFEQMGYSENAKAASDYADTLSRLTGIDDETIRLSQTKLATFSEVAKSTELMGEATTVAADLMAAGFGDMSQTSVMVGKALQDPIKGVGALSRVGVTFSDKQKKMIKTMVETGDTAGAQAIIMDALQQQVGGTAEASADASDKMSNAFGEVSEAIGTALLPVFEKMTELAIKFGEWAQDHTGAIIAIGAAIAGIASSIIAVNVAMKAWQVIQTIVSAANLVLGTSFTVALGPVLLIAAGIAALVAVGVLLWKNWDKIKEFALKIWNAIGDFFTTKLAEFKKQFPETFAFISAFIKKAFEIIKKVVSVALDFIKQYIQVALNIYKTVFKAAFTVIWNVVKTAFTIIKDTVGTYIKIAFTIIETVLKAIKAIFKGDFGAVVGIVKEGFSKVVDAAKGLIGKIKSALGNLGSVLFSAGKSLVQGLINGIKSMAGVVVDALLGLVPGPVRGVIGKLFGRSAELATLSVPNIEMRDFGGSALSGYVYTSGANTNRPLSNVYVTYQIQVDAMTADRNAGAQIVKAIKNYEATASNRWRTA